MDAVKFMDERARMCNACNQCHGCPITDWCGEGLREQARYSADIVAAVEKWSAAHPRKTRQSEFLRAYPNATLDINKVVIACPTVLYGDSVCPRLTSDGDRSILCTECRRGFWLEEVK